MHGSTFSRNESLFKADTVIAKECNNYRNAVTVMELLLYVAYTMIY